MRSRYIYENDVEVYEIKIKQMEYEEKIVRLIKTLLEIDQGLNRQEDEAISLKEAA